MRIFQPQKFRNFTRKIQKKLKFTVNKFSKFGYTSRGRNLFLNLRKCFFRQPIETSSNSSEFWSNKQSAIGFCIKREEIISDPGWEAGRECVNHSLVLIYQYPFTLPGGEWHRVQEHISTTTPVRTRTQTPRFILNHAVTLSSYKLSQQLQAATIITKWATHHFFQPFEYPGSRFKKF